jgi:2-dehydro-3-deoxygluconokinase
MAGLPALRAGSGDVVAFGELMVRLTTPPGQRLEQVRSLEVTFGGAEANVCVSLARFGRTARFVTRLPDNDLGRAAAGELRRWGVGVDDFVFGGDRIGIYFLETGAAQRGARVLYDRAGSAFAEIGRGEIDWRRVLEGASWFHATGITPAISASAAEAVIEAVTVARDLGVVVSLDLNYRAKLWRWGRPAADVMPELVALADVVIANEEDAEQVLGIAASGTNAAAGEVDPDAYESVCREIAARFANVGVVAITIRGSRSASDNSWSAVAWDGERFLRSRTYEIRPVVDRVGAGDAFVAGLIESLHTDSGDLAAALEFAVAASCLKHSISGDFNVVTRAEVEAIVAGSTAGRVAR